MSDNPRRYRLTLRGRLAVALVASLVIVTAGADLMHAMTAIVPLLLGPLAVYGIARRWFGRFHR